MSAKTGLWMLIAGSVLAMVLSVIYGAPQPAKKPPPVHAHERPWLSREAMEQLVSPSGGPGPLFASLTLGGPPPDADTRNAVEAFASVNGIEIHLDVEDGELAEIRVGVTFGGCCGYEGADALGRLLHRTRRYPDESARGVPSDRWNIVSDEGVNIHARVVVNRIDVRWHALWTVPELLDHAEALAGRPRATARARAGDRWHDDSVDDSWLDVPFAFSNHPAESDQPGVHIAVEGGRVSDISFSLWPVDVAELRKTLRTRWGRPRVSAAGLTWHTAARDITVKLDDSEADFAIHANAPATTTALARAAETPAPRS